MSYAACGACPSCSHGKPSYCNDHGSLNFSGARPDGKTTHKKGEEEVFGSFFQQSSFATYALAGEQNVVSVDKDLPLDTLSPLGCGIQTGAGAVINTFQAESGSSIAVFGCGAVGRLIFAFVVGVFIY